MPRFFIKPQGINNNIIRFDELQSKKIRKVLRLKVGDMISGFDGKGWRYEAQLIKVTNDYSLAKIVNQELVEERSNITIIQALPKNLKIEFILQKCTELGADRFIFFESDFSQVDIERINHDKLKRWRRITQESCEQCGRIFVPTVELFTDKLEVLINHLQSSEKNELLYLDFSGRYLSKFENKVNPDFVSVFIGPEGGFSQNEKSILDKSKVKGVKIHNNILRSETAGMAFLAQLETI